MIHKRNTAGIKAAAQKKRQAALERTEKAIAQLVKERKPVNFSSVAEAAEVSKSWLYEEANLREQIEFLREKGASKRKSPRTRATKASQNAVIRNLKEQNSKLREEVKELKSELEGAYGMYLSTEEENKQLKAQITFFEHESGKNNSPQAINTSEPQGKSSLEEQLEDLIGTKIPPDLMELIQTSKPEVIKDVIAAFKAQLSPIDNPGGWLRRAIREKWKPSKPIDKSNGSQNLPSEFTKWYSKATQDGFLLDIPINELSMMSGEFLVKIRRKDTFGAPYTAMPWKDAKREWAEGSWKKKEG